MTPKHYMMTGGAMIFLVALALILSRFWLPVGEQKAAIYYLPLGIVPAPVEIRENSPDYSFINPLLYIETNQRLYSEFDSFNSSMSSFIRSVVSAHRADSVSIYLRDLNTGHWTGVNEDLKYEPSSMLKVAVMIAYFRSASDQAQSANTTVDAFLNTKIYYPGPDSYGQNYPPPAELEAGYYSYLDLIKDMIQNSDNVALDVLISNNRDEFNRVYHDFRLPPDFSNGLADYMTARSYSVILRTLYNSTYLPWNLSEQALGIMASTTFDKGIAAGTPQNLVISHKFGEHTTDDAGGNVLGHELHDCGIVYYPVNPYLLCVMTAGKDFGKLESIISTVASSSYQYMSQMHPYLQSAGM